MEVIRLTSEDIESLNIDGFFDGHNLAKDIHGLHYYPCERLCKSCEMSDEQKALFDSLEKVEVEDIEREEIE